MIILLDVDGVLVESNQTNIQRVNEHFGTNYCFEDIETFEYDFMTEAQRQFIYDECWHDPSLYDGAELTPEQTDTLEGLRRVARVIACSSPLVGHIESKYRFLKLYFDRADIVLASDKNLIGGDILVDDGLHNLEVFPGHVIVYDRPWNRSPGRDLPRAHNFEEIGQRVLEYLTLTKENPNA